MGIEFGDLTRLAADFAVAGAVVQVGANAILSDAAAAGEADARAISPVLTGEHVASIEGFVEGDTFVLQATSDHSDYLEWGTSDTAPQPSIGPAFERQAERATEKFGVLGVAALR